MVAAGKVDQGAAILNEQRLHLTDENGVIACLHGMMEQTFEVRQSTVNQGRAQFAGVPWDTLEAILGIQDDNNLPFAAQKFALQMEGQMLNLHLRHQVTMAPKNDLNLQLEKKRVP